MNVKIIKTALLAAVRTTGQDFYMSTMIYLVREFPEVSIRELDAYFEQVQNLTLNEVHELVQAGHNQIRNKP